MGRIKLWADRLRSYPFGRPGSEPSRTQVSAEATERFVREVTEQVFPDAWIFRTGTQQHPDFLVANSSIKSEVEAYAASRAKHVSKDVILSWEAERGTATGIRVIRLEVKSTRGGTFILNDTFPDPRPALDEVYVMFAEKDRKVYVTTSATMAQYPLKSPPPIADRYVESAKAVRRLGTELKEIWDGTPVRTAARPTYSVLTEYARTEASEAHLIKLFAAAGLPDY